MTPEQLEAFLAERGIRPPDETKRCHYWHHKGMTCVLDIDRIDGSATFYFYLKGKEWSQPFSGDDVGKAFGRIPRENLKRFGMKI